MRIETNILITLFLTLDGVGEITDFMPEVGPVGEAPGDFPQAFTHLALISACHALDQALGEASSDRL